MNTLDRVKQIYWDYKLIVNAKIPDGIDHITFPCGCIMYRTYLDTHYCDTHRISDLFKELQNGPSEI